MKVALMKFVKNDHGDTIQGGVGLDASGKDSFGHNLNACVFRNAGVETDGIADGLPRLFAQAARHPAGGGHSGDPPRLEHDDAAPLRFNAVKKCNRDTGCFTGAGGRLKNHSRVSADGLYEPGHHLIDRICGCFSVGVLFFHGANIGKEPFYVNMSLPAGGRRPAEETDGYAPY